MAAYVFNHLVLVQVKIIKGQRKTAHLGHVEDETCDPSLRLFGFEVLVALPENRPLRDAIRSEAGRGQAIGIVRADLAPQRSGVGLHQIRRAKRFGRRSPELEERKRFPHETGLRFRRLAEDREMLEAAGQGQLEAFHEREAIFTRHEGQRRFEVGGVDGLRRADRHVRAEREEVVVAFTQKRKLAARAGRIEADETGAFVVVGLVAHLGAARDADAPAVEQPPELPVDLRVPDEKIRAAKPVFVAVDAVVGRGRIFIRLIDDDLVVHDFERHGKRVKRRRIRAVQGAPQERFAHLETFVFVRLRAGGDDRRLPLPRWAELAAQAAEHAP